MFLQQQYQHNMGAALNAAVDTRIQDDTLFISYKSYSFSEKKKHPSSWLQTLKLSGFLSMRTGEPC